ncbi:hypothetical protein AAXB25_33500 [Paenibacillus lautus]|uniref:hypothetical protein n=1 Tax=Paenibacillus lautus TaxID=1401 RepID=UPI003D2DC261
MLLEQNGYVFQMNNTTRIYTGEEVRLFRDIKRLTQGLSVDEAITMVLQNQQQDPMDFSDIQGKIKDLDQYIDGLEKEIFWNGQKNTIEKLMREWEKVKKSLNLQNMGQSYKESID